MLITTSMVYDFYQLQALETVISEASFQKAAKRLFITQSAVSQRVRALEDSVGEPLIIRSAPPTLTEAGQRYVSTFQQIKALMADLPRKDEVEDVRLPIATNTESFDIWINKTLMNFSKSHRVLFDIHIEDQDQTIDLLKRAVVLGCISSEEKAIQGCARYFLKAQKYVCVAHRSFIKKMGLERKRKEKILSLPTAIFGPYDKIHDNFLKHILGSSKIPPYVSHTIPSVSGILESISEGAVFAVMPLEMVQNQIKKGDFVDLFPKTKMTNNLYWHVVQTKIPVLQELTDQIISSTKET